MRRFRLHSLPICWLVLLALADWLFYARPLGWALGAYLVGLVAVLLLRWPRVLREGAVCWLGLALVGLAVSFAYQPGPLSFAVAAVLLATLAMSGRETWLLGGWRSLRRQCGFALYGWAQWIVDLLGMRRVLLRRGRRVERSSFVVLVIKTWTVPVLLTLVFVALFAVANPVISGWLESLEGIDEWIGDLLSGARILFWALVGMWLWALLRARAMARHGRAPHLVSARATTAGRRTRDRMAGGAVPAPTMGETWLSTATIVRSLILFNVVFAVQTVLDVSYLFGGAELPEGMTYASYAHRGAYPLVATALLAAVFVLITFRAGSATESLARARRLVYAWIAQNLFLTFTAVWRLGLYIDVYSLTRLRVAAGIWMVLVALGLVWICLRILLRRENRWLVRVNYRTAALILWACCFVDFDGGIASYNAAHCYEITGRGPNIDLGYLYELGEASIPALVALSEQLADTDVGTGAADRAARLREKVGARLEDWRGWTWLRSRVAAVADASPAVSTVPKVPKVPTVPTAPAMPAGP